jgi:hypothetical protein
MDDIERKIRAGTMIRSDAAAIAFFRRPEVRNCELMQAQVGLPGRVPYNAAYGQYWR